MACTQHVWKEETKREVRRSKEVGKKSLGFFITEVLSSRVCNKCGTEIPVNRVVEDPTKEDIVRFYKEAGDKVPAPLLKALQHTPPEKTTPKKSPAKKKSKEEPTKEAPKEQRPKVAVVPDDPDMFVYSPRLFHIGDKIPLPAPALSFEGEEDAEKLAFPVEVRPSSGGKLQIVNLSGGGVSATTEEHGDTIVITLLNPRKSGKKSKGK